MVSDDPVHPAATLSASSPTSGSPTSGSPPARRPLDYARPLFAESQAFTKWRIWVLLLIPAAVVLVTFIYVWTRFPLRRSNALLFPLGISLAAPALLMLMRMSVVVTSESLTARFFPLRRRIAIADIASFRAITYTLRDFGGWGIKWARDRSLVLNVSGNRAMRINRRRGKSLILGTQRPEEFAAALEELGVAREAD
jgi:hypothetical protein